jgi:tRNA-Thr(GGU) m(6)t(6)A37 methyltransferase TsaA
MPISYKAIGILHSPFKNLENMPIQPGGAAGKPGTAEIYARYVPGLKDLDGFSHIYLLYHLHKARSANLLVTPFLDAEVRGIFATRAPSRPNPIGLSLVRISSIRGNLIHIKSLDVLDGTPLLDIKPYVPAFENGRPVRIGWLRQATRRLRSRRSDGRFK